MSCYDSSYEARGAIRPRHYLNSVYKSGWTDGPRTNLRDGALWRRHPHHFVRFLNTLQSVRILYS